MTPTVALLLPCHDEAEHLPPLLEALLAQLEAAPTWRVVAVDDSSTDATGGILDGAAAGCPQLTVIHGRYGSPGGARSVAADSVTVLGHGAPPDWLLTIDCDVELPPDFVDGWARRFAELESDESVGAINGGEEQGHLFDELPNARRAGGVFGRVAGISEAAVGVVNLNGVNHAVRTSAYLTAGPYLQPVAHGVDGCVNLAGEDWDLGVRLRVAGYSIAECEVAVRDRGRRLLADVHAYLSGEAYEGEFTRLEGDGPPRDLDPETADSLAEGTAERVLLHFFFKPVLACPSLLGQSIGLSDDTKAAMSAWMERWPSPTFAESRHGFVYGRLPRFAAAFTERVRAELGLAGLLTARSDALPAGTGTTTSEPYLGAPSAGTEEH